MASTAAKAGLPAQQWASYAGLAYNGASVIGYAGFGFLANSYGRKPVTIVYVLLAWLSVPILFLWTHDLGWMLVGAALCGIFVSGQYTWMAAWLPEFFPTRIRATAAGFVFNMPRLIAWVGPLISGWIIANAGGFSQAALWISSIYIVSLGAMLFLRKRRESRCPNRGAAYCACTTSGALGRSRLGKDAHVGAGHSMKVEGEISVAAPRARVFERLSDAEFFASCIDGVSDLTHNGGERYGATFTTRVAFMRFLSRCRSR